MASSEAEENVSPANYFYEGLPQLLPEYDSLLIQLAVLHLTVWQVVYDLGKGVGRPPVEVWVETLRRIPSKEANPLEELSRQAPAEERTEEIEEISSDDNEQDEQEEQEQQAQEGTEENPVDVERDTVLNFALLIAIVYLIILLVLAFVTGALLASNLELENDVAPTYEEDREKLVLDVNNGFRRRSGS